MADNNGTSQNGNVAQNSVATKTTRWYSDLTRCSQPGGRDKFGYVLIERRDKVFPPEGEDKGGTQVYGLWKTPKGRSFLVCTMITDDKGEQILKTRDLAVGKAKLAELVPDEPKQEESQEEGEEPSSEKSVETPAVEPETPAEGESPKA